MPIYEYACGDCQTKFEKLVKSMGDATRPPCPQCRSKKTARAMSVFAVSSNGAAADAPPSCGRCGGAPGSCMSE